MASVRSENRGRRGALWLRVRGNRGRKGALWLRVATEAKGYPPLASPQYASIREPVHNMKNNRCQKVFLHWCDTRNQLQSHNILKVSYNNLCYQ